MAMYRPLSLFVLIVFATGSIFYFLQGEDAVAQQLAFFAFYAFICVFYLFKSLYYRKHGATFNELFYVFLLPIFPPIFVVVGQLTGINDLYFSDLISASVSLNG